MNASSRHDGQKVVRAHEAMEMARRGAAIHKSADPTEDERRNISLEDARRIAAEDPSLLFCEVPDVEAYLVVDADNLGPKADGYDVSAYNAALREAWLDTPPVAPIKADALTVDVLVGYRRDWQAEAAEQRTKERPAWVLAGRTAAFENQYEAVLECPAKDADFSDYVEAAPDKGLAIDWMREGWDAARREMLRDEAEKNGGAR